MLTSSFFGRSFSMTHVGGQHSISGLIRVQTQCCTVERLDQLINKTVSEKWPHSKQETKMYPIFLALKDFTQPIFFFFFFALKNPFSSSIPHYGTVVFSCHLGHYCLSWKNPRTSLSQHARIPLYTTSIRSSESDCIESWWRQMAKRYFSDLLWRISWVNMRRGQVHC